MSRERNQSLTADQWSAIGTEATPLIVRAGAGSGKTLVLVERYLRLVCDLQIPPRRILAATFTEKAAAQMKERVAQELYQRGESELIAELNAAPICTLHGFCSRLISPHTLRLGIDPGFRMLEEYEATLLQEETLTELLTSWRESAAEKLNIIVGSLHWSSEHNLRPGRSPASRGFSRQFLELVDAARCAGRANIPLFNTPVDEGQVRTLLADLLAELHDRLKDINPQRANKSQEKAFALIGLLERCQAMPSFLSPPLLDIAEQLQENIKNLRGELCVPGKRIKEELRVQLLDCHYLPMYQAVQQALNDLTSEFLDAYHAKKTQIGALDFSDLEEKALEILSWDDLPPPVDQVLIDEAQDLNPVQWDLINKLSANAPLFVVGDIQQSIYGFRHAAVDLFTDKAQKAREGFGREITLQDNFRSHDSILSAINCLFDRLWRGNETAPFMELVGKYPYPPAADAVELLLTCQAKRQEAREREAQFLARRIHELIRGGSFQVHEPDRTMVSDQAVLKPRPPRWSDVLVLVRSGSSFAALELAFREQRIPYLLQAGRGFWDALEISDLLALLRSLEDPADSFSLACLLRSPAVGFSDDDLLQLHLASGEAEPQEASLREASLYDGLCRTADAAAGNETLPHRADRFLRLFSALGQLKDRLTPREMLQIWLEETGLEARWLHGSQGQLKINNVRKFLQLCDTQAGESSARLRTAFEEIRLREVREGTAPQLLAGEGAVRLMTVHAAKGLEAPIVALFDMNHPPRSRTEAFVYVRDRQAAFCLEEALPHKPYHFKAISDALKEKDKAESERLLYVAMTRAREKLLLSASCAASDDESGKISGWLKLLLDSLNLDKTLLIDTIKLPSGPLHVTDRAGAPVHHILLSRYSEASAGQVVVPEKPPWREMASGAPAGFPAPAEDRRGPFSVVEFLRKMDPSLQLVLAENEDQSLEEVNAGGITMGRWVHRLLQVLSADSDKTGWSSIAEREALLLFGQKPTQEALHEVLDLVLRFHQSSLGTEIRGARQVWREFPFLFQIQNQLLRGKLDLAFRSDSGWTLVDYKSDRLPLEKLGKRLQTYKIQLALYALGWESLTGSLPQRSVLFFLSEGRVVELDPEKAALEALCTAALGTLSSRKNASFAPS